MLIYYDERRHLYADELSPPLMLMMPPLLIITPYLLRYFIAAYFFAAMMLIVISYFYCRFRFTPLITRRLYIDDFLDVLFRRLID